MTVSPFSLRETGEVFSGSLCSAAFSASCGLHAVSADAIAAAGKLHAKSPQRLFAVVARAVRLFDGSFAFGKQAGEQHRGLHLRAGDGQLVIQGAQTAAADAKRQALGAARAEQNENLRELEAAKTEAVRCAPARPLAERLPEIDDWLAKRMELSQENHRADAEAGEVRIELDRINQSLAVSAAADAQDRAERRMRGQRLEYLSLSRQAFQFRSSIAGGLALSGKIPFASSFAVFLVDKGYDQLRMCVAYPKVNAKFLPTPEN